MSVLLQISFEKGKIFVSLSFSHNFSLCPTTHLGWVEILVFHSHWQTQTKNFTIPCVSEKSPNPREVHDISGLKSYINANGDCLVGRDGKFVDGNGRAREREKEGEVVCIYFLIAFSNDYGTIANICKSWSVRGMVRAQKFFPADGTPQTSHENLHSSIFPLLISQSLNLNHLSPQISLAFYRVILAPSKYYNDPSRSFYILIN